MKNLGYQYSSNCSLFDFFLRSKFLQLARLTDLQFGFWDYQVKINIQSELQFGFSENRAILLCTFGPTPSPNLGIVSITPMPKKISYDELRRWPLPIVHSSFAVSKLG
ncbi:hypothetical protein I7I50_11555 [Histoplasma capsulatum G186AR]|uniref:Uncharacterized protein n=1 Tax=Ajellomyces capsulatus TaxID=5037 RepID=A0A8H7ZB01_AJECA|nr:hypothetical protein I7I52_02792 [Histoplasma capsulatum]QSS70053.1 hypothetical protein I7I50_11555 [Histoplasma capsulatum G186AR]